MRRRVFGVTAEDRELVWEAIREAAITATIEEARDRSVFGHYTAPDAAPRLVTAYPTP